MMSFSPKKLFRCSKQDRCNKAETVAAASSPPGVVVSLAPAKHLARCPSRVKSINTNTKPVFDVEGAAASPAGAIMSSPDKQPLRWPRLKSATTPSILEDVDAAPPCPVLAPEDKLSPIYSHDAFPPATPPFRFRTGDEYTPPLVWGKTAADGYSHRPLALLGEIQSPPPKFSMTANGVTGQVS